MIDNRLDYISDFKEGTKEEMSRIRNLFIALDIELVKIGESQVGHRCLAISRTSLETSLSYAIKTLALQGEKRK